MFDKNQRMEILIPDFNKIELLIKYVLAVAGRESGLDREIGAMHIIKYIYLADLAYAELNNGETCTGLPWRFHHYGPWCYELHERIEPTLADAGAGKRQIQSKYDNDFIRWTNTDGNLFDEIDLQIDRIVTRSIQTSHGNFANSTHDLLRHVYRTKPMLYAAPEERLNFTLALNKYPEEVCEKTAPPYAAKLEKKRESAIEEIKEGIKVRLERKKKRTRVKVRPKYDEIFEEGVKWLDSLAGPQIEATRGRLIISDEIWKSEARRDPDGL